MDCESKGHEDISAPSRVMRVTEPHFVSTGIEMERVRFSGSPGWQMAAEIHGRVKNADDLQGLTARTE